MAQKILYFTAGPVPTGPEAAEIAALQTLTQAFFEVKVRSAAQSPNYGDSTITGAEACDFLAGSPPSAPGATGGAWEDVEEHPIPGAGGAAVVYDGQVIDTYTITVTDGVVSIEETP